MTAAPRPPSRVVVVGASAAGLAAVEGLRRLGYAGSLTLVGDEPHLPYDRPPLSKQLLSGEWDTDRLRMRTPEVLEGLDLDLRLGEPAAALDTAAREVVLAGGERLPYDALVVATGLTPRRIPGAEGVTGAYVLRTVEDALALRDHLGRKPRMVVAGAGFVGAEAAAVAVAAGADVTLVSAAPVPLADVLGDEIGTMLAGVHREHGVRMETGALVTAVTSADGAATGVRLSDGREIAADAVVMGVGAVPAIGWLAGSGLSLGDGVECDATLYAGSGVWAAGDVACWLAPRTGRPTRVEHRTHAAESGLAVARNILAGPGAGQPFDPVPFVWSDQYDLRIQIYGRTRGADEVRVVERGAGPRELVALYRSGDRVCGVVGVNRPRQTRGYRALVAQGADWHEAVGTQDAAPVAG
ncbi:NAD(P)/FAD-dependent oxidoreductase [Streptantibioticus silvisoli]|uniref:FAD/NAD(P)-binding oxidoreductase n=1 Tax=Streptantibioticus silvisoli TaxID=2705255 RepID=A0ABT6W9V9_9ACTN|nr:FAD/NAD(P)-binding oxidoreductase [Streptantibioticus silvisoli]MDI5966291.1 FAD/NAD(P)-binding oxidoreductase [Streptantibioticus silvisoli]